MPEILLEILQDHIVLVWMFITILLCFLGLLGILGSKQETFWMDLSNNTALIGLFGFTFGTPVLIMFKFFQGINAVTLAYLPR